MESLSVHVTIYQMASTEDEVEWSGDCFVQKNELSCFHAVYAPSFWASS